MAGSAVVPALGKRHHIYPVRPCSRRDRDTRRPRAGRFGTGTRSSGGQSDSLFDCARHDHFDGMLLALFSLESLGYRRIGLVLDSMLDVRTRHRWYSAYLLWKSVRGFSEEISVLFYDAFDIGKVTDSIKQMKLDALVSPRLTLAAELRDAGVRVPEDIGVAGLDRPSDARSEVAGISQHTETIGSAAADLLVSLVRRGEKGVPAFPSQQICGGLWVEGATARCVGAPLEERSLFDRMLAV